MLIRGINRSALALIVINSIIGAGIFGLPSKLYALAGVYSLAAFGLCAAVVAVYALCYAEVSSRFPQTGGPYLYVLKAFGPLPAFFIGWLLLLSRVFNYAVLINLLVTYLGAFSPQLTATASRIGLMSALTAVLTFINYIGVKAAARASSVITVAKLVPLAIFIVVGFLSLQPSLLRFGTPPPLSSFSETVLLLIFAFGGFESASVITGEVREPQKNLPFALFAGLAVVTVFYCGIQTVCIGTLPAMGASPRPVADAAVAFMGKGGGWMIVAGAIVSITGTLNVLLLSGSRLPFAISREGQLPRIFSYVHPQFATPTPSLVACALLCLAVSVAWTFLTAVSVAVIIRVLVYGSVCASLIRLRNREGNAANYFKVSGGKWVARAGLLISMGLLSASNGKEWKDVALCLAIGLIAYGGTAFFKRRKKAPESGLEE